MDIESRSGERTGEARPRWKRVLLSGSLAATLLASSFLGMIPQAADGAIAGVQKVLDEQGQTLDEFDEAGDDCGRRAADQHGDDEDGDCRPASLLLANVSPVRRLEPDALA